MGTFAYSTVDTLVWSRDEVRKRERERDQKEKNTSGAINRGTKKRKNHEIDDGRAMKTRLIISELRIEISLLNLIPRFQQMEFISRIASPYMNCSNL